MTDKSPTPGEPVIPATEDHPAIYRDGSRLVAGSHSIPSTPDKSGEPTHFATDPQASPFDGPAPTPMDLGQSMPETCAACGGTFDAMESRLYWGPPTHWVVRQRLGPIHSRCQKFSDAKEDALRKVLSTPPVSSPEKPCRTVVSGIHPVFEGRRICGCDEILPTDEEVERLLDRLIGFALAGHDHETLRCRRAVLNTFASLPPRPRRSQKEDAMNWFSGLVPTIRPDETIAEGILATVAAMRKDGSLDKGTSLCWSPAELEQLAMFAIGCKNDRAALTTALATAERERDEARKGHFPNCPAHPDIAQCVCDLIAARSIHPTQTD